MPIYEYQCPQCCHIFEKLMFSRDTQAPECPKCGCGNVTRLISAGAVRPSGIPKGSGGFPQPQRACNPGGT